MMGPWRDLRVEPVLFGLGLALLLTGLVAISSASVEYADWHFQDAWHHTHRHLMYLLVALAAASLVLLLPLGFWLRTGWAWLLVGLAALVVVLLPGIGKEVYGAQRWLAIGPFSLQPSEFAKLAILIYLAGYLVRQAREVRQEWSGFIKPAGVLGLVALLLLAEPDFGATVIIGGMVMGMLFLAGARLAPFLTVLGLALGGLVLLVLAAPYRMQRLTAYTDPWADPYGSGFQLIQSLIAFGRGEWFGVGLGNSVQKLFYLPEAHTDFVFSIWAEETGFIGALALIGLFVALIWRVLQVGRLAQLGGHEFGANLCYGVALVYAGQAFVNMGVSAGLLPTKGLTLPFVSYGGSSLIVSCCMLALVLRVAMECPAPAGAATREASP
ncbi:MAG: putative lipid II flippase FtsW [Haliea sp.]|nr:putative lipid II flippase FtsW [Haliea sp.]